MRRVLLGVALLAACSGEPRAACDWDPPDGELGSVCGFRNPEDVEYVPSASLLLVSQMQDDARTGGSIAALALDREGRPASAPRRLWPDGRPAAVPTAGDPRCSEPADPAGFAPHGLAAAEPARSGPVRVAVVAHGARESVELFDLVGVGPDAALRWRGCVRLPPDAVGNDVSLAADGALYVTNYQPALDGVRGLFYRIVGGLGLATGEVLVWRPGAEWQAVPGTRAANPNGVLAAEDGRVYVAATGSGDIHVVDPGEASEAGRRSLAVGGHPDNLARDPRGAILAVTHRAGFRVLLCLLSDRPCHTPWSLLAIDPETLAVRERLRHDGSAVGGVASAAPVAAGRVYFGAVAGDRIGVWRPAPDRGP